MKKHALLFLVALGLILSPATGFATEAETETVAETPDTSAPGDDTAVESVVPPGQSCATSEVAMGIGFPIKRDCSVIGPCSQWNSSYCSYSCAGDNCCEATILIPGSFCPDICA